MDKHKARAEQEAETKAFFSFLARFYRQVGDVALTYNPCM
jgi:hypothetical protein